MTAFCHDFENSAKDEKEVAVAVECNQGQTAVRRFRIHGTAASKMPRVDAIGESSAGVHIDNRAMVASLFIKVPDDLFEQKVKNIYLRAAAKPGENILIEVANDADEIYLSIGTYLGHSLAYYALYYGIGDVLLLGRVMSGRGGDIIIAEARRVLSEEYPSVAGMELHLPDKKVRRVGQSIAASSLPKISKSS